MYALFASLAVYAALFGSSAEGTFLPPRVNRRTANPAEPEAEPCAKPNVYTADLVWTNMGASPGLTVTLGGTNLTVLVDLGSSVFWVPGADWECVDDINTKLKHVPQENCAPVEGGTTSPDFTFSGGQIPGARFNSTYNGGKTGALGIIGYEDITIDGGLAITNVTTGVATGWDNPLSGTAYGMMGMGFPPATSYWPESELEAVGGQIKDLTHITHYNPVAIQAAAEGVIAPMFGYYYDGLGEPDGTHCGQMTFGGEPDIPHGEFTADIPIVPGVQLSDPSHPVFDIWNIHVDGFKIIPPTPGAEPIVISYLNEPNPDAPAAIPGSAYWNHTHTLDTGAYFSAIPDEVYFELIKHFDPPLSKEGSTACDAKIPQLAVTVGGKDVWFNESGILYPEIFAPDEAPACDLAIIQTEGLGATLGTPFLINVVAVHEFAEGTVPTVKFAQRIWE